MSAKSATRWAAGAAAVLRRAGAMPPDAPDELAWSTIATTSLEGVPIPPLGTADRAPRPAPGVRGPIRVPGSGWDIRTLICDRDAARIARDALADLEGGVTSLWLTVGGGGVPVADLPTALDEVYLDLAAVVLRVTGEVDEVDAAEALVTLLRERGTAAAPGTSVGADPVGRALRRRERPDPGAVRAQVSRIADVARRGGIGALVVDATTAHDHGAAEVDELGYSVALAVEYLRDLTAGGASVAAAAAELEFRYAATGDQFLTIAKLRAARALWHRVRQLCGLAPGPAQRQHVVSSAPMMTRYDPWGNVLRGTVAAFAAGVSGADAVTVLPFDLPLGRPEALGRRLARNTSSLLISEARAAQVNDPAGGAHAVEMLTAELADRGWREFQRIEGGGGILAAVGDGSLHDRWAATAAERSARIADRRFAVTGVTEFPDPHETLLTRDLQVAAAETTAPSWAADFERLRDRPAPVPVFLARLGPVHEHTARATFATNAFLAGGIAVQGAEGTVDEIAAAFRGSPSGVVCLAGSPQAYGSGAIDLVPVLRASGARWIITTGPAPTALAPLVDDHVERGVDLLTFLTRTREYLHPKGPRS